MNVGESKNFSNISATTAAFTLKGGRYAFFGVAIFGGGNIAVQALGPDGSTWVPPLNIAGAANTLMAAGEQVMDPPPGQYRIAVTTATAVYASLSAVPS